MDKIYLILKYCILQSLLTIAFEKSVKFYNISKYRKMIKEG